MVVGSKSECPTLVPGMGCAHFSFHIYLLCVNVYVPWQACGGWRIIGGRWCSPSTVGVLGIELRLSCLVQAPLF